MLTGITNLVIQMFHLVGITISAETAHALMLVWAISNIVSTMPTPNGSGLLASPWYKWLFNASHGIMGNLGRLLHDKFDAILAAIFGKSSEGDK